MPPALSVGGPVLLLAVLLGVLYHAIAVKLVTDWYQLPDFSHGFLIPFFAAYLLWDKRRELQGTPIAPSWAGVWLVALGSLSCCWASSERTCFYSAPRLFC